MKRIIYLDYLRIFAILGVILIHLTSYVNKTDIYCKEFGRYAVPCFVMISGVLFLGRNIPLDTLFKKYVFKLAIALIFILIINKLISVCFHINCPIDHLWYIPMIICIYMAYPFIKLFIDNKVLVKYFLVLALIFNFIIPTICVFRGGIVSTFYD
ncbi:MAG: acyltransferase family protein [Abditibacteriota bacterium]|nr:acyltransferase family protein [Abditibacteriota bacterium]